MSSKAPSDIALDRKDALLLLVDVQDKLARAMPREEEERIERNASVLLRAARRLGLPAIASEQYPKGLGATVSTLRELLPEAPIAKDSFSCASSTEVLGRIQATGRRQVILLGMETHVCVFQTARDLVRAGFTAFVPEDAVISRSIANKAVGLRLLEKAGATVTCTETVLFDLLGQAGTPEFKELSPLIK